MKVAMMTNNYKPFVGGVPISVERLSCDIRKLGHEVTVFAPTYKEQIEEEDTIRYASLGEGIFGGIAVPNPLDPDIEKQFKAGNFDIIHVHHPIMIGRSAQYLSWKYNVPMVFTYHTRYEQYLHYAKLIYLLEKNVQKEGRINQIQGQLLNEIKEKILPAYLNTFLKSCSHIFLPTVGMRDYLNQHYPRLTCRSSILPTGLEGEAFGEDITDEEIYHIRNTYKAQDIPLFCSVSRIGKEKNIYFLLTSLAQYKQKYKKPFRMLMIGEGPDRKNCEELCRELDLSEEVIFTGKIKHRELPAYYKAADLFLFASQTETQGIVICEAMAAGTPVIAVEGSGVSDIVTDGVNGFTTKMKEEEFSRNIDNVISSPDFMKQLSEGAKETANYYAGERIAQMAVYQYEEIIRNQMRTSYIVNQNVQVYN